MALVEANVKAIAAVKPGDKFEQWHQVTCRSYSLTDCRHVVDRRFRAAITIREIGALSISELFTFPSADDPIRATRRPCDIRQDPREYFMLWLLLDGRIGLAQNGHTTLMQAGDLFFYDQSQPFELNFNGRSRALMVTIPGPLLTARAPTARIAGRRIAANPGLGALAASLVQQLYRLEDTMRDDVAQRLGASALDILAATLNAEADALSGSAANECRLEGTKQYMLANLDDSGLDLERIAKSQGLAPRTLYRLFAAEGTTPIRWLWQQRLAASFKALTEGKVSHVTDAALSHGFSDVSHFSRSFRAAFGQSPRMLKKRADP